jgi:hypothetical protein
MRDTLKYLDYCGTDHKIIHVFVADQQDYEVYKRYLPSDINLIKGVPTLKAQRNFIRRYFPEGEVILNFDDDVISLQYVLDNDLDLYIALDAFVEYAYTEMTKHGTKLFGVFPVANHYFMDDTVTTDLRYIVGAFWGCINDHSPELDITVPLNKEDFERSIIYYRKFGSIVRFNNICVYTKYFINKGGLHDQRTVETNEASIAYLLNKYPGYCTLSNDLKHGFKQIKLIANPTETNFKQSSVFDLFT